MAITQNDLNNLETRIKLEITTDQQKIRHNQNNELQKYYNIVDDLKTDSALSKQSFTTMEKNLEELKDMMKNLSKEIKEEFKSMQNIFATKEEHHANKVEIELIKATHWKVITWVIGTVGTILIAFLWLIIKTLWIK